ANTPAPAPISVTGGGELTDHDPAAIAYDRTLAPKGAQASLTAESIGGQTVTSLVMEGFRHARPYGAHLHAKPCGKSPDAAGPHFMQGPDHAEIWLDLRTDGQGAGRSTTRQAFTLDPNHLPKSLVIHAEPTAPGAPPAPRVACITLH
ncbi:MAG: hypothetical protein HOY71_39175, partial [Nonomuraea sp.]|nr:hypothetical protein [Nonomuraea sp.]